MYNTWIDVLVDALKVMVIIGIMVGLIFGLIYMVSYGIAKPICTNTLNKMNVEGSWGIWEGCMVNTTEFEMVPLDQYMFVITTNK